MESKVWQIVDLIQWGNKYLISKKIPNAKHEIEWFLCEILSCEKIDLYLNYNQPLLKKELNCFKSFIKKRIAGEPFQYIINKASFYGRDFIVNKSVLIPRPETELLIHILKNKSKTKSILEIGTGSGCIAITLSLENISSNIIATDISNEAISIAKKNCHELKAKNITFKKEDFLNTIEKSSYDIIISNPPYIPKRNMKNLQIEVRKYEPQKALTDNKDGLSFYHKFSEIGHNILNKSGILLLEFGGEKQKKDIENIFKQNHYSIKIHYDLQKNPRVAEIMSLIN